MNKNRLIAITFIALSITMGCRVSRSSHNNSYTLKFNMQKGDRFDYTTNINMNMKQNMMGTEMNITNNMTQSYTFEAGSDSGGWKNMSAVISKIVVDMNAGPIVMKYNSDEPNSDTSGPTGMLSRFLQGMKGGQFSFSVNDTGEIREIKGIKEIMQKSLANANLSGRDMMLGSISKAFDENQFKQNMQQIFDIYPGKPVKPGDSWAKNRIVNSNGMIMKLDNIYTLQSVNKDTADIKLVSKITSGSDSTAMAGMQINMNGNADGDMKYDLITGLPQNGLINTKMNMKLKMQGMDMPMDMEVKMTFTGKKL